jgi:urease accessory protein
MTAGITIIMTTIMTITEAALYRLMSWLTPSYPTGAFSYSHGLEYAVEEGLVSDPATLAGWVAVAVDAGTGQVDGALLAAAWQAAAEKDDRRLAEIAALASAWRGTAETALESTAQGAAFLATTRAAWAHPLLDRLGRSGAAIALPVAVGAACSAHDVPLVPALTAYLHAIAANLVSAGVRLIPLGQTDGQEVIAGLEPVVARAVQSAAASALDEVGSAAPMIDWCSMRHELQYTRLFRS